MLTDTEAKEISRANASGLTPVVFVHGLWLLPNSWDHWRKYFEEQGYTTLAPGWPDDPATVEEARAHPEVFANKGISVITSHYVEAIRGLKLRPAIMGHSTGGSLVQKLAGLGLAAATVVIDPAPVRGVLPLPFSSLKVASAGIANPANVRRAVTLTFEQFQYGWTNALNDDAQARRLYEQYHVAGSGRALFSLATANLNPWTEDQVDSKNPKRGPMLFISGEKDHTAPWAIVSASYERQKRHNEGVTEIVSIPNRGHSLTIDDGWKEVAGVALSFVKQYAPPA